MGNCCLGKDATDGPNPSSKKTPAFTGAGHRLGSASESQSQQTPLVKRTNADDAIAGPVYDFTMTDAEREKQRTDRLAAVEARMKAQKPKKPKKQSEPLRGPNSQPAMTWTV